MSVLLDTWKETVLRLLQWLSRSMRPEQCLMVRFMISIKLAIQSEKLRILLKTSLEGNFQMYALLLPDEFLKLLIRLLSMNLKKKHGLHRNISIHLIFWQLRMHIIRLTKKKIKQDFIVSETPL